MPQISKPVVEVVVAQMLHMALHDTSSKRTEPILIAINSEGTQNERGEAIASDVEPFAILDVMMAINPRTQVLFFTLHCCIVWTAALKPSDRSRTQFLPCLLRLMPSGQLTVFGDTLTAASTGQSLPVILPGIL